MKNKLRFLLALMASMLLALSSCSNSITTTTDNTNFVEKGITLKLEPVEGAVTCDIFRKKIVNDTEEERVHIKCENYTLDNQNISFVDYLVNPGDKYKYDFYYRDSNNKDLLKKTITCVATEGNGDIVLTEIPNPTYNEETSIMSFPSMPKLSPKLESYILNNKDNCEKRFTFKYQMNNNDAIFVYFNKEINCYNSILNFDYLDTPLTFKFGDVRVTLNGIYYQRFFTNDECANFPKEIVVKDNRLDLDLKNTQDGVLITFPPEANDISSAVITRYEKDESGNYINNMTMFNHRIYENNMTSFIDYFVEPNKTYYYEGSFWNNSKYITTKKCSITAKKGSGEIKLKEHTTGTYDEKTGVMTFDPNPSFAENSFIESHPELRKGIMISYYRPNFNNSDGGLHEHIVDGKANFQEGSFIEDYYGYNVVFSRMNLFIDVDEVTYNAQTRNQTVPETIFIPDLRKKLTLEEKDNAIHITLPPVPEESKNLDLYGTIQIKYGNRNNTTYDYIELNNESLRNKNVVIDYFVKPNTEYEYTYTLYGNWQSLYTTVPESITFKGTTDLSKYLVAPEATYDQNTSTLTITKAATVTDELKKFLSGENVQLQNYRIIYEVENPNPNYHPDSYTLRIINIRPDTKTIDVSKVNNINEYIYGKKMVLDHIKVEINISNDTYIKTVDSKFVPGMPSIILNKPTVK